MNENEWIEIPTAKIRLRDEGILETRILDESSGTLETAKLFIETHLKVIGSRKPAPMLLVFGQGMQINVEGRHYIVEAEEWKRIATRIGVVTNTMVGMVLFNFFTKLKEAPFPVKIFPTEEEALAWLRECLK